MKSLIMLLMSFVIFAVPQSDIKIKDPIIIESESRIERDLNYLAKLYLIDETEYIAAAKERGFDHSDIIVILTEDPSSYPISDNQIFGIGELNNIYCILIYKDKER